MQRIAGTLLPLFRKEPVKAWTRAALAKVGESSILGVTKGA